MENKELELLREYFNNDVKLNPIYFNLELKDKILEIQKQNKLKSEIDIFSKKLSYEVFKEFNEILKELGYEC